MPVWDWHVQWICTFVDESHSNNKGGPHSFSPSLFGVKRRPLTVPGAKERLSWKLWIEVGWPQIRISTRKGPQLNWQMKLRHRSAKTKGLKWSAPAIQLASPREMLFLMPGRLDFCKVRLLLTFSSLATPCSISSLGFSHSGHLRVL